MQLTARGVRLAVVLDEREHEIAGLTVQPFWRRTPGGYEGEHERWSEAFVHEQDGVLWVRVVSIADGESGEAIVDDAAVRSDDAGRSWSARERTSREVATLPVIAELTTHPSMAPKRRVVW